MNHQVQEMNLNMKVVSYDRRRTCCAQIIQNPESFTFRGMKMIWNQLLERIYDLVHSVLIIASTIAIVNFNGVSLECYYLLTFNW